MTLETLLDDYPKELTLKDGAKCVIRPLEASDEAALNDFVLRVPEEERMFIKHRVTDPEVIRGWCQNIDYDRNLPMLAFMDDRIIADATLHQQLGGWKRHIGRISVLVDSNYRGRWVARGMMGDLIELARYIGLKRLEAEFIGRQQRAMKMFAHFGFVDLVRLPDYVKDMQAVSHDYIIMGLDLATDEEYAGMG